METSKRQVRILCSYGGKLQASPIGNKLIYRGGNSRLIPVDRNIDFQELIGKLCSECRIGDDVCLSLKYRLPGVDLDTLVTLSNDEDLENMMLEYQNFPTSKTIRIRIFLDVEKTMSDTESGYGSGSGSESGSSSSIPDYLFGFDKEEDYCKVIDEEALEDWKTPSDLESWYGSGSGSGSESGSSNSNPDYLFGFDKEEDYCKVIDEKALEEWKIPHEQNPPKSESNDQGHVAVQPQNLDGHVMYAEAAPTMFYYPPEYGWEMVPAYIVVTTPVVPAYYVCVM